MKILTFFLISLFFTLSIQAKDYKFSTRQKGSVVGYLARKVYDEINKELEKEGMRIILEELPGKRDLIHVNKGLLDGDIAKPKSSELTKKYPNIKLINESIVDVGIVIIAKKNKINEVSLENPKFSVGIISGSLSSKKVTKKLQVTEVGSYRQLYDILKYDRVDMIIAYEINGFIFTNLNVIDKLDLAIKRSSKFRISNYPAIHKKNEALGNALDKVLKRMKTEGRIDQVVKQVGSEFYPPLGDGK